MDFKKLMNSEAYDFLRTNERLGNSAVMGDASFLIVKLSDREKFGVVAFKKQLSQYMEKTGLNAAFCFDEITRVYPLIDSRITSLEKIGGERW